MPRRADHHARRVLIAEALLEVASRRGLEAVSLRHVAAEAGVTSGMVQHYFGTKDEMLVFASRVAGERVRARARTDDHAGEGPGAARRRARALLVQLLPLDDRRRDEARVSLAFWAYAAVHPALAAQLRESTARLAALLTDQIRAGRAASDGGPGRTARDGEPARHDPGRTGQTGPDGEATGLLALTAGLAVHVLGGHCPPATALTLLETRLDALFGPPAE
ncbi:TetR family transcriptional regulator C-terminal domain-containing protein [Spongiactinospora sp. TRM90649]|uniref:TetR family transcriptional regulator C-terminal domain-containing protein n=1 Tax=Spongiactinospora sp. TRM90649 TaxID=3031114 RepID=UPI0023F752AD|nr:TetR family transcriptional regulator C-terminal domain-containing protein [Spongiactinospora sp. TRM90649]MDF5756545.1 TetR family transcriptional regulator C-terminal domain-containing protein [Spongiactinospora sp. TRM90649]